VDYKLLERMALENCGMVRHFQEDEDAASHLKGFVQFYLSFMIIQGMEHLPYKDRLRAGAVRPGQEGVPWQPESGLSASKRRLQERKGQTL